MTDTLMQEKFRKVARVKLVPVVSFNVYTVDDDVNGDDQGVLLGQFTRSSEWEGMTRLSSSNGSLIVRSPHWTEDIFSMFGIKDMEREAEVISASDSMQKLLFKKEEI